MMVRKTGIAQLLVVLGIVGGLFYAAHQWWRTTAGYTVERKYREASMLGTWVPDTSDPVVVCAAATLAVHQPGPGEGVVIWEHRKGALLPYFTDTEWFDFLSLELLPSQIGRSLILPVEGVRVAYSTGGYGDAWQCKATVAKDAVGTVSVERNPQRQLTVSIDLEFRMEEVRGGPQGPKIVQIRRTFVADEVARTERASLNLFPIN